MPKTLIQPRIQLTKFDKLAFDPELGCANDLNLWSQIYFDGEAYPWQQYFFNYLGSPTACKDKLVIAGIRTGKSRLAAMAFCHMAMFHRHMQLLNVSISSEQAKIVYHNCMELLSYPRMAHWVAHMERSPYPKIQLINGSEMNFRSVGYEAELIRGFQFDLINIDEAAYITSDAAIKTLKGRLIGYNNLTQEPLMGLFWQMSTPKGKTSWLFDRWKKGDPRYEGHDAQHYLSLRAKTTDNPRLSEEDIQNLMRDYTQRELEQEIEGIFLDATDTEFSFDQLMYCCNNDHPEVQELYRGIRTWNEKHKGKRNVREDMNLSEDIEYFELPPEPGRQYLCSWDLGKKPTKSGRNATVGMVWDITSLPWKVVAFRYVAGTSYVVAMSFIEQWQELYSSRGVKARTVIDASGKGDVLNELIELENRIQVEGMTYSSVLKPNLITAAKIVIERGMIRYPYIRRFIDQMSSYTLLDNGVAQDIVMAFAQAAYTARQITGVSSARPSILVPHANVYRRQPNMHPSMRRTSMRRHGPRTNRFG